MKKFRFAIAGREIPDCEQQQLNILTSANKAAR
jgi:hypothetical protein